MKNTDKYTIPKIRNNLICGFDPNNLSSGREPCQMGWYDLICDFISNENKSQSNIKIIDVGCGMMDGVKLMRDKLKGCEISGQDIDDRLSVLDSGFIKDDIKNIPDGSYDYVTCLDVIEHVEYDLEFFNNLKRICKNKLFITTPNYTRSKAQNTCHCREYTIPQFINFFKPNELWVASPDGVLNRTKLLEKTLKDEYYDISRDNIILNLPLNSNISFVHSTVDGLEWAHYLGIFKK